jgi:hypothetical protein
MEFKQWTESGSVYRMAFGADFRGADPGLCANCVNARRIESDRGSIFILCQLSFQDSSFAKYPRLPVLHCGGYVPKERELLAVPYN